MKKAYLLLADGRVFSGNSFGFEAETSGEVVFNTSIQGYQEILTDPSYHGQIVVMTYPHIGNYGINPDDMESCKAQVAGFIVKSYCDAPSSWRSKETLAEFLIRQKIAAGTNFDTRSIVRHIRDKGAMPAILFICEKLPEDALSRVRALPSMNGQDLAKEVTCKEVFTPSLLPPPSRGRVGERGPHILLYDFGVKLNIIRMLQERGCAVTVVPAATSAEDVLAMKPDGIVLSNGPGDPAAVTYAIENIKQLLGKVPIFGICLGHQLLALALGGRTYKLKFGHRGGNQPVKNLKTGRVEITSQNHGFAVDAIPPPSMGGGEGEGGFEITHINLNDNTVEGLAASKLKAFSVQYHPEASPGPHDAAYLFNAFIAMM
ncbi:MAG: glutamine-hydrolyzing carbamoyl-phosphate synthase small subunit [Deltaproteobacteria bacterium]|nr:glutamine-hydrolyzing carbamoyl-phosphate synthase small subunit [Deltaproteobacteria bacterium]